MILYTYGVANRCVYARPHALASILRLDSGSSLRFPRSSEYKTRKSTVGTSLRRAVEKAWQQIGVCSGSFTEVFRNVKRFHPDPHLGADFDLTMKKMALLAAAPVVMWRGE